MNDATITGFIFATFFTVGGILAFISYIISAVCLHKIAVRNDINPAWIAYIPILQFFIIGKAIEEYSVFGYRIPKTQWTIFIVIVLKYLTTLIPHFGIILGIIVTALWVLFLHKFFYLFDSRRAFLYALLCILGDVLVNIPLIILLIILRDKTMVNSPATYEYPF